MGEASRRATLLAASGATVACLALLDVVHVVRTHPLAWTSASVTTLALVATASLVPVALVAHLSLRTVRRRVTPLPRRAALVTLAATGTLALAVLWFTDPPPFTDTWPTQGHPLAWLGASGALAAALVALDRLQPRIRAIVALVVTLTALAGVAAPLAEVPSVAPPATDAPNVLLVTLDTARADHFGGAARPGTNVRADTRNFDALAREGVRFDNAIGAAPVTGPSHASLLSGSGPWDHGVLLNGVPLPERPLLAEVLHDRGWQTGAFVSAYVLDGELGFARGFDVYDDSFGWSPGVEHLLVPRALAMLRRATRPDEVLERRGGDTVDAALRWLDQRDGPWFLWVHLFDPHGPYTPPPPWDTALYQGDPNDPANHSMDVVTNVAPYQRERLRGITDVQWVLAQYAGEISHTDSQLGRLLRAVEARGERDRTAVAVVGDHGESLGEGGVWFNHGDDAAAASVHVPFALRFPGRLAPGSAVTSPVEGNDLAPTLLSLVGVPPPPTMTGLDLAPVIAGSAPGREIARALCFDRAANVADRAAGRIETPKWRMAGIRARGRHAVFHERDEGFEVVDLGPIGGASAEGAATPDNAQMERAARAVMAGGATTRSADAELGEDARARLEALGYLDPLGGGGDGRR